MASCAAHERSQLIKLQVPFRLSSFTNTDYRPIASPKTLADGSVYYGLLSSEQGTPIPDGIGTLLSKSGTYSGEFCSGLRHGWGMCTRAHLGVALYGAADAWLRYEGVWDNNTRHGYGYLRLARGCKFYGQFRRNKRHGSALEIISDGRGQVWRTTWKENICIAKAPVIPTSSSYRPQVIFQHDENSLVNDDPGESDNSASSDMPWTTSSSSFETANGVVNRAELWTAEALAAALSAAGVDRSTADILIREQVTGRVISILIRQMGLDDGLTGLGFSNPYVRRYCVLIIYALLSLKGETVVSSLVKNANAINTYPCGGSPELCIKNLYVERRIGEGGYGRVYRGKYDFGGGTKIQVACKVFRQSELWRTTNKPDTTTMRSGSKLCASPLRNITKHSANAGGNLSFVLGPNFYQGLREFESESANHCRLHHPNVVKYYGVIRHPLYAVISEYVPCGSLFDLLHRHRRKLSLQSWLKISEQIAYALSYLHSREIIHCDLKTSNILITQEGDVKICDFGLSHSFSEDSTSSGNLAIGSIGTVQWMSPEALRGEALTSASDIYSLGVILWEILTGEIPYTATKSVDHILGLVGYAGLSLMNPFISGPETNAPIQDLPPNVINVIKACLHPDPAKRPSAQKLNLFFQKGRQYKFLDFEQNIKTFFGL